MPKIPHVYYDKGSKTYYAVASLGYDSLTGKRMQKKKRGFVTQAEAKKWYDEFMAKHSRKAIVHGASLTVGVFLDNYFIPDYKNKVSDRTFLTFSSKLKRLQYFSKMKIIDVLPIHVKQWHTLILKEGLSNNYLKDLHQSLKEIFDMATSLGIISENPVRKVKNVSRTKQHVDFWTKEEFERFIKTFEKVDVLEHLKFITCLTLFMTGLRISELQALVWDDIDFENKSLKVSKSIFYQNRNNWQINPTKTFSSNRIIYLDDMTLFEISKWREHQQQLGNIEFVFSYNCMPITKTMLTKAIKDHSSMADVKVIRIHDLRHSHASLMLSLGMNDLELKNRLGHASIQTTLGVYSHLRPTAMKEIADKLEGIIDIN
ncbi:site-specific integrase [Streptococcus anginosus]|uniref:site-specific integrase n=1 Tax=Streptococcus anginosus TaxID=1328 RepID=UPI0021F88942|nr:site-specific integrase [Streptococcus anginosus]MCW1049733.1 site-specific integrase [Streptococcus anginosus]MCW1091667.1 site-specific integrase [Streptococcus anginosus]HEO2439512.1 site-specific integrase [Streptococcus agalactiae]